MSPSRLAVAHPDHFHLKTQEVKISGDQETKSWALNHGSTHPEQSAYAADGMGALITVTKM